jgi:hypothetical protein
VFADAGDDAVEIGMEERLAAADGDDVGSERRQPIQALVHGVDGDRLGVIVVFVAVGAGEIAAPHGDDVGQNGMAGGCEALGDHAQFADSPGCGSPGSAQLFGSVGHTGSAYITAQSRRFSDGGEVIGA